MKRLILILLIIGTVSAWNPYTKRYICETAVKEVWGSPAITNCLTMKSSKSIRGFCDAVYDVKGVQLHRECLNSLRGHEFFHASEIPEKLFNDSELHHDYSKCPARPGPAKHFICGDKEDKAAQEQADIWFNESLRAGDLCLRIYEFCIGANYYSDSEDPLNQMMKEDEDQCRLPLWGMVDERLMSANRDWSVHKRCKFVNLNYEQDIWISSERVDGIIEWLIDKGENISKASLAGGGQVVLLANSIDFELAFTFFESLRDKGVHVTHITPDDFTQHMYEDNIIILGGQNAPEGVGDIVRTILTSEERAYLVESPDRKVASKKESVWKEDQNVWILAGYDRHLTQNVSIESVNLVYQSTL